MDVPDIAVAPFPDPTRVEKVLTPGAVMSGFSQLSPVRGPRELKLAKPEGFGLGSAVLVTVTVPPAPCGESALTSLAESEPAVASTPRIPKNGMVTVN